MRGQLAQQAQEILGHRDWVSIPERGDDVARLIGPRVKMGFPEVLAQPIPRHWTQRGRSGGWAAVRWLADSVTEGDPRKVSVATSLQGMRHPLSPRTAQAIAPLDCRDDRLSHRLNHLSQPAYGHKRERALHARRRERYALAQDVIRGEATPVSGDHAVPAEGLGQGGPRQEDPARPQSKGMLGSLAPLGRPLAPEVVSGKRAEAGLDLPRMARIRTGVPTPGRWCVGEGHMSAWATRADLARPQDL